MQSSNDGTSDGPAGSEPLPLDEVRWWSPFDERAGAGRSEAQVDLILTAFTEAQTPVGVHRGEDGAVDYLYRQGVVLTRERDAARVRQILEGGYDGQKGDQRTPADLAGLHVVRILDGRDADEVCADFDNRFGAGVVMLDHVVHVCHVSWCSATEPFPAGDADGSVVTNTDERADGRLSRVVVVDTGLRADVVGDHDFLKGVDGGPEPLSVGHYKGHGTFIAGVVRSHAPAAEVHVIGAMATGGATFETDLIDRLDDALDLVPDIISLSAGVRTRRNLPPMTFEVFWEERLQYLKGTVLIAAAGNDGDRGPFWPAAFPWAVSVGALEDDRRAGYSNYGSWVDVYAPGTHTLGAYPKETYEYLEPPQVVGSTAEFPTGFALWSGTSFSAPMVAGLTAARMTWSGESGRQAAHTLLDRAKTDAVVGVGAVLSDDRHGQS